jgi:hypothetical protein
MASLAGDSGIPVGTLGPYLELLETLFLIQRLPAWSTNLSKRVVSRPKVALLDTGLAARLVNVSAAGAEVDLVLETDDGRVAGIEVKATLSCMSGRGSAARSRRQETDGGQRCLRHWSHVANPAGGSSMGSLPWSSPGVGMSMLAAHSASSSSDIGQVVYGASAWR